MKSVATDAFDRFTAKTDLEAEAQKVSVALIFMSAVCNSDNFIYFCTKY